MTSYSAEQIMKSTEELRIHCYVYMYIQCVFWIPPVPFRLPYIYK